MNLLRQRMSSDRAASNTTETIIIIALAVFAALALFTFILTPVRDSADEMGGGIKKWMGEIMNSQGEGAPSFTPTKQGAGK